ncbi:MAG: ferric reductase-like transmembrane domain-containing protein [Parasphingorhabdus sp.]|uniref:ferric reductase-like transmembrane domain-containing protein n=1 Tax=Parasphingorhabdus sp. TaxID=2709688 RepID=UPI003001335A
MSRYAVKALLWTILSIPAILMLWSFSQGKVLTMDLLHPSGEMSVRLMILAMLPGPLSEFFSLNRFFRAWLAIRRNLGVAAFAYALLHLVFYVIDMNSVAAMLDELGIASIWTGWLALALMIPPAAISFNLAMRRLGKNWKKVQRLVYLALIIGLVHWILLDWDWRPAIVHLSPLIVAWILRNLSRRRRHKMQRSMT